MKPKSNEKLVRKKSYRLVSIMIIDAKSINKLLTKIRFSKSTYFIHNHFIYIKFKLCKKKKAIFVYGDACMNRKLKYTFIKVNGEH